MKKPNYYEPDLNPSYQELAEHYHVAVLPARVRKPRDKAHVENGVQNVEHWILAVLSNQTFFSIAEATRTVLPLLNTSTKRKCSIWANHDNSYSKKWIIQCCCRSLNIPMNLRDGKMHA